MKITQHFESGGLRVEATIESKNLETHSVMQSLSHEDKNQIQVKLLMIMTELYNALLDRKGS